MVIIASYDRQAVLTGNDHLLLKLYSDMLSNSSAILTQLMYGPGQLNALH